MLQLKADECRVLGVLVEKALTTPAQYPLTLNALTSGCNQKNNRFPVVEWDEDRVYDALDGLRQKKLASEVMMTGSRVPKFKHNAREVLGVDTSQLVVLAELMLRGPQSIGDIRGNASRMHPLESLETARTVLDSLMQPAPPTRDGAMVKELPPAPGGRAKLFAQLLCPELHAGMSAPQGTHAPNETPAPAAASGGLEERIARLERDVAELRMLSGMSAGMGPKQA